jgi:ubiquinone/menaquinone biosynthesis C-methylase UbiE
MTKKTERWRRYWDKQAQTYDRQMSVFDRFLFADSRDWVCRQAVGDVLEVAIGTGLNLDHYPPEVRLTGIENSAAMLQHARRRAEATHRDAVLLEGDAQRLDFPDAAFDTVVCTYALCAIPDEHRAVAEMWRVLRPGGLLLLADHVASSLGLLRGIQRILELVTVPVGGEHFLRRPLTTAQAAGFEVLRNERFKLGIVERVAACKPRID